MNNCKSQFSLSHDPFLWLTPYFEVRIQHLWDFSKSASALYHLIVPHGSILGLTLQVCNHDVCAGCILTTTGIYAHVMSKLNQQLKVIRDSWLSDSGSHIHVWQKDTERDKHGIYKQRKWLRVTDRQITSWSRRRESPGFSLWRKGAEGRAWWEI